MTAVAVLVAEAAQQQVAGDAEEVGPDRDAGGQVAAALEQGEEAALDEVVDAVRDLAEEEAGDAVDVANEEGPASAAANIKAASSGSSVGAKKIFRRP